MPDPDPGNPCGGEFVRRVLIPLRRMVDNDFDYDPETMMSIAARDEALRMAGLD